MNPSERHLANSKKVTLGRLRRQLTDFQNQLSHRTTLTQKYLSWFSSSDYLRVVNADGNQNVEQLSLDCLTVLLVGLPLHRNHEQLGDDYHADASIREPVASAISSMRSHATVQIAAQLELLERQVDQELWQLAANLAHETNRLAIKNQLDLCEQLLNALDPSSRKATGSYFTPNQLAELTINEVNRCLVEQFELTGGLLDTSVPRRFVDQPGSEAQPGVSGDFEPRKPFIELLDPAAGTGAFMMACLRAIKLHPEFSPDNGANFVSRLKGIELHPSIATHCFVRIYQWCRQNLAEQTPSQIPVWCGDTLRLAAGELAGELSHTSVVIGNPPFNSLSTNTNAWIQELLNGHRDGVSYFEIKGQPIKEKKSWLHDDYIKFFRLAHHLVDNSGAGIIALITNRAYIDNLTFRGMRWQLAESFHSIQIRELAGDSSLFPIATPVALSVLCKTTDHQRSTQHQVKYQEPSRSIQFEPKPPHFLFRPTQDVAPRYLESLSITDAFLRQGSAVITARDWFITDFDREALVQRLNEFCNLKIPDHALREKYFSRCRSRRYIRGDTRGWRLSDARKWLSEFRWEPYLQRCCYRPFDRRWILWLPQMIDWPRPHLMQCIQIPGNRTLVARRQFPAGEPACYFWAVNDVTIDGIIRSDNRGNETLFPLRRINEDGEPADNLSPAFLDRVYQTWGSLADDLARDDRLHDAVFDYIYGLFYSPAYRQRFGDALSSGYPRILLGSDRETNEAYIDAGERLARLHLSDFATPDTPYETVTPEDATISGAVYLAATEQIQVSGTLFDDVQASLWEFRIGTHQVLRKWIQDGKGRSWTTETQNQYRYVIDALRQTQKIAEHLSGVQLP